jgi:hypothetical protein
MGTNDTEVGSMEMELSRLMLMLMLVFAATRSRPGSIRSRIFRVLSVRYHDFTKL